MEIDEIKSKISECEHFDVYDIEYKSDEDKEKYGKSFDTYLNDKEYVYITVNGGTFKVKRIVEEYGRILFIYNGEEIRFYPDDIVSIDFDDPRNN